MRQSTIADTPHSQAGKTLPMFVFAGVLAGVLAGLSGCGAGSAAGLAALEPAASPAVQAVTNAGTDFYLTLPDHLCVSDPAACNNEVVTEKLIVAAASAVTGTATFNGAATQFSVAAGGQTTLVLDPAVVLTANETVQSLGVHVTASSPVSVYVTSEAPTSADGYMGIPTPGLGTQYTVMAYSSSTYSGSEFAVVATQNATTVTITPSAAGPTHAAGVPFTISLGAGQTYQVQNTAHGDMTGTVITSNLPVGVFGGHRCTDIPSGTPFCDYMVEEMSSQTSWGKTFQTAPFSGRARYNVRILAETAGTAVTTTPAGIIPGTLAAGQFVDLVLTAPAEFVSSSPVEVAQYMRGNSDDSAGKGDPSMAMITPSEMGVLSATFGVDSLIASQGEFLNVITTTAGIPTLKLDGAAVNAGLFTPIGGTSTYSTGIIPVAAGAHTMVGTSLFNATAYDFGIGFMDVSYAYPVAATLVLGSSQATGGTGSACKGDVDGSGRGTGYSLGAMHKGEGWGNVKEDGCNHPHMPPAETPADQEQHPGQQGLQQGGSEASGVNEGDKDFGINASHDFSGQSAVGAQDSGAVNK